VDIITWSYRYRIVSGMPLGGFHQLDSHDVGYLLGISMLKWCLVFCALLDYA